ncbi:hypothetical protein ENBRE01_0624 [Enteropsectra breve]|nr:hypothetical protein ENBRE01_0624 [Enteropsectra breve]
MAVEVICNICKEPAEIEHSLPCMHTFCFLCLIRHVKSSPYCPVCRKGPFYVKDMKTEHPRNNGVELPPVMFKRTIPNYTKILKKYQIRTDGGIADLERRYSDLYDQMMLQQFRDVPLSKVSIAWRVHQKEGSNRISRKIDLKKLYEKLISLKERAVVQKKKRIST